MPFETELVPGENVETTPKQDKNPAVSEMIGKYKEKIKSSGLDGEIYKWQLTKQFAGRPDTSAPDFKEEITSINYSNLMYPVAKTVINHIAKERPEEFRNAFKFLFDESIALEKRVSEFPKETMRIYRELEPVLSHHEDERTISTFLAYYDCNKYPFFKDSFYQNYCKKLGVRAKGKGAKYIHYIELVNDLIENYILPDAELIVLKKEFIPSDGSEDESNYILAQDILFQMLEKDIKREPNSEDTQTETEANHIVQMNLNTILYGPPGTGKTYNTINTALEIIGENINGKTRNEIKRLFDARMKEGQIIFTTFHQSMSYEDFIEGIKPQEPLKEGQPISYKVVDGIFKQVCKSAETLTSSTFELSYSKFLNDLKGMEQGLEIPLNKEIITVSAHPNGVDLSIESTTYINSITKSGLKYVSDSQRFAGVWGLFYKAIFKVLAEKYGYMAEKKEVNKKYVLIIDEINRGNVSQIFGELITLIEDDKRLGKPEALETTLPYSKEKFGVPPNLYIIGTMNTADRSVEALDTALRRRFSFMEMMPDYTLEGLEKEVAGFGLGTLLETINKRIEKLLDRDHQIGHSYFLGVQDEFDLMQVFRDKVIPLLQEYFYGNYERMGMVLGTGFVEKLSEDSVRFAKFPTEDHEYSDKVIYRLKKAPLSDSDLFAEALLNLMN